MASSDYDAARPPEPPGKRRRRGRRNDLTGRRRRRDRGGDGTAEMSMVPDVEVEKLTGAGYYGHPVVKPPPWGDEVALYLFLGGVAGGSGVLAAGAQLTGRDALRRSTRLGAVVAVGAGAVALVADLGRPDRFYNMLRTFKVTSPMSVGSWILSAFSATLGLAAAAEVDRLASQRLPLGPLRPVLRAVEAPAGLTAGVFGPLLAVYTAALLGDTATPTWNAAHRDLPLVFVCSASTAASGLAMVTTPVDEAGPARTFAMLGAVGDVIATRMMERRMDSVAAEPLHHGTPGILMRWAERLTIAGGAGALVAGRSRAVSVASGLVLLSASACTRFGVFHAGIASAKDPRYTIIPQKNRLAARRSAGITDDSITTAG